MRAKQCLLLWSIYYATEVQKVDFSLMQLKNIFCILAENSVATKNGRYSYLILKEWALLGDRSLPLWSHLKGVISL